MKCVLRILVLAALIFSGPKLKAQEFPDYSWTFINNPAEAGWDTARLSALKKYIIDSTAITGMMLIRKNKVIFSFGDLQENSYIASCRKSLLSILYGEHIKSGQISLDASLNDLHVDDNGGLLTIEKEATVRDIISARSGVFHPASYPGDYLAYAPPRGSVKHGDYWLYCNWDFNVAGYIFEKQTGKTIYNEVARCLAMPLHMQDWDRSLQQKSGDTTRSRFMAYPIWLSTRDMARIGQLMLNGGSWGGRQLIDSEWVHEMIKPRTSYKEINANIPDFRAMPYRFDYGYMWWLWHNDEDAWLKGGYSAFGNMGQSITVFPSPGVVIVYKTKEAYERETPLYARFRVLDLAVHALKRLQ